MTSAPQHGGDTTVGGETTVDPSLGDGREQEDARLFHDDPDEWDRRHWPLGSTAEPPRG